MRILSATPGADIYVDGVRTGSTPLAMPLWVRAGERTFELRREGFQTASTRLSLAEGAVGEWVQDLVEDPAALASEGGLLALQLSQSPAVLTVDGVLRGPYLGPLPLLPGPHRVEVARAGFFAQVVNVEVSAHQRLETQVSLEPTPELRNQLDGSARLHRAVGFAGLAVGGAALAGGIGALVYYSTEHAAERVEQAKAAGGLGYSLLGAGVLAATVGIVSFASGPARYESSTNDTLLPWTSLRLEAGLDRLLLAGRF